jgi:hypothetical protein
MYASHSKHKMLPEAVLLNTNTPKLAPSPPPAMRGPRRARRSTRRPPASPLGTPTLTQPSALSLNIL